MACPNMNDLVQLESFKLVCVFLTSRDVNIAIRQLNNTPKIGIRLQGQLNIDAGLVNQNDDLTLV